MIPVQTPLPKIPLGTAVEVLIEWIQVHLHGFLTAISRAGTLVNDNLVDLLLAVPPLLMVVVFVLVAWKWGPPSPSSSSSPWASGLTRWRRWSWSPWRP